MPVEIEIKMKVDDLAAVRERLKRLRASHVRDVLETNIFFDTPDRALLASDCGLRLRISRDLATGKERLAITYKGPREEGEVKTREEIEVGVDSAEAVVQLLEKLGYVKTLTFEKRRETWKHDKCLIELDRLPHLGSFVEIECPTEELVLHVREKLGLSHVEPITQTYADLVSHHLSDVGHHHNLLSF